MEFTNSRLVIPKGMARTCLPSIMFFHQQTCFSKYRFFFFFRKISLLACRAVSFTRGFLEVHVSHLNIISWLKPLSQWCLYNLPQNRTNELNEPRKNPVFTLASNLSKLHPTSMYWWCQFSQVPGHLSAYTMLAYFFPVTLSREKQRNRVTSSVNTSAKKKKGPHNNTFKVQTFQT